MENEFPPNSHTKKEVRTSRTVIEKKEPEKKEVRRVATGKVVQREKPLYKKFLDAFRPEDNRGFVEYVLLDVFVTGVKDNIADAAIAGVENALGTSSGGRRRRSGPGGRGHTSYNRMSTNRTNRQDEERRPSRRESRESVEHNEIILDSRVEAEEIIDTMIEMISKYDVVTKRDLFSMLGEPHTFTDEDWGWTDLRGARAHRISGGYLLDLPRPEHLD